MILKEEILLPRVSVADFVLSLRCRVYGRWNSHKSFNHRKLSGFTAHLAAADPQFCENESC